MEAPQISGAFRRALQGHAVFRFTALVLGFGFQVMVVKILSPQDYASYAVLLATLLVGERLLSLGTDRTVLRFVPRLVLKKDRRRIRLLAARLALVRGIALSLFVLALLAGPMVFIQVIPGSLSFAVVLLFGGWFLAYSLLKEADAIAQSLIIHHRAALIAAGEVLLRFAILAFLCASSYRISVVTIVAIYTLTSSASVVALAFNIRACIRNANTDDPASSLQRNDVGENMLHRLPTFAAAAYASTLSYLISSPGVIRLVAREGLGVYELAAFSFVQGLAMSLSSALPGQLIMPSLESVAAKMTDSGGRDRVFPMLSLLLKIELVFVLSMVIVSTIAGAQIVRTLSRPAYAPYYYILPALMFGFFGQTLYRLIEIIGSMNLKYRIFLTLWPLSLAAMIVLYLTVGRWGLISVLTVPLVEIATRVGILTVAFRKHSILKALDPARSLRIVATAALALLPGLFLVRSDPPFEAFRLLFATGTLLIFLLTLFVVRPLTQVEYETLSSVFPPSWSRSRSVAALLTHA